MPAQTYNKTLTDCLTYTHTYSHSTETDTHTAERQRERISWITPKLLLLSSRTGFRISI